MPGGGFTHVRYVSDDGNNYRVRIASWVATRQSATAATTEPPLPRGYRMRRRYYKITASGKEESFVVVDTSSTDWTDAFGTSTTVPTLGSGTATAVTLQGRTGERDKAI